MCARDQHELNTEYQFSLNLWSYTTMRCVHVCNLCNVKTKTPRATHWKSKQRLAAMWSGFFGKLRCGWLLYLPSQLSTLLLTHTHIHTHKTQSNSITKNCIACNLTSSSSCIKKSINHAVFTVFQKHISTSKQAVCAHFWLPKINQPKGWQRH